MHKQNDQLNSGWKYMNMSRWINETVGNAKRRHANQEASIYHDSPWPCRILQPHNLLCISKPHILTKKKRGCVYCILKIQMWQNNCWSLTLIGRKLKMFTHQLPETVQLRLDLPVGPNVHTINEICFYVIQTMHLKNHRMMLFYYNSGCSVSERLLLLHWPVQRVVTTRNNASWVTSADNPKDGHALIP